MDRRDFLKLGAAGLAVTASPGALAEPTPEHLEQLDADVRRGTRRVRRSLKHMETVAVPELDALLASLPEEHAQRAAIDGQLVRSSIRSLFIAGSLHDVPAEAMEHEEVAAFVGPVIPEVDFAVAGALATVEGASAEDRRRVQEEIRRDPRVLVQIGAWLDNAAAESGASTRRRLHLKRLFERVSWRLQRQSADLVLDEVTAKVRRRLASSRPLPWASTASNDEVELWQAYTQEVERLQSSRELPVRYARDGSGSFRAAGISAAVGVGSGVLAAVLIGAGANSDSAVAIGFGLFLVTACAVLLITALILLVVGATRRASWNAGR